MASLFSTVALTAVRAAEEAGEEAPLGPWLIGGAVLAFLVFVLLALVWFGGGRDHS